MDRLILTHDAHYTRESYELICAQYGLPSHYALSTQHTSLQRSFVLVKEEQVSHSFTVRSKEHYLAFTRANYICTRSIITMGDNSDRFSMIFDDLSVYSRGREAKKN